MTWEILLIVLVLGVAGGLGLAYLKSKRTQPYKKSLSQIVREGDERDPNSRPPAES